MCASATCGTHYLQSATSQLGCKVARGGLIGGRRWLQKAGGRKQECSAPKDVARDSLLNDHVGEVRASPVLGLCQVHDNLLTWAHARQRLDKCEDAGPNELGPVGWEVSG